MATETRAELHLLSALAKVFPSALPADPGAEAGLYALSGETVSFQAAYRQTGGRRAWGRLTLDAPAAPPFAARRVLPMPGNIPAAFATDAHYLRADSGLFPDLLSPTDPDHLPLTPGQWQSVWFDFHVPPDFPPGAYPITITLLAEDGVPLARKQTLLRVAGTRLPRHTLAHTEWLHADCLAQYYGVPVFSGRHWRTLERFTAYAAAHGANMLLTPIHTPPLDTAIGGERETVQLLDVIDEGDGRYRFGFDRLLRFAKMARRAGIETLEIAHLFTQWGARHAPKIIGVRGGVKTRLFGWDTDATGDAYANYLRQMLPALAAFLDGMGLYKRAVFHLSDEPGLADREAYRAARAIVTPALPGARIADAVSDLAFYRVGLTDIPICATDHIDPFLSDHVPELWCYYCCAQSTDVSNRFFAQPLSRLRALGAQMYRHGVRGFLHWGYNFYNSMHSVYPVNPFHVTDADGAFPSGDPFIVYPGADGAPMGSIRLMALQQAFQDVAALQLLETTIGRAAVWRMIDETVRVPLTFRHCPSAETLLSLRRMVFDRLSAPPGPLSPP